jgi:hypothetical protein
MLQCRYSLLSTFLIVVAMSGEPFGPIARASQETPKDELAAQIRTQGFTCDRPQQATRDPELSKPDYEVWVLQCGNATYRIGRYPDREAKIEQLR